MLLVPVGMDAITSLHLGAQQLSHQDVCRMRCRPHRGSALGLSQRVEAPNVEACPPLEHCPASWALFCLTFEEWAELLCSSWPTVLQSCPHRPPCIGI